VIYINKATLVFTSGFPGWILETFSVLKIQILARWSLLVFNKLPFNCTKKVFNNDTVTGAYRKAIDINK
jgi:hypothetical protein